MFCSSFCVVVCLKNNNPFYLRRENFQALNHNYQLRKCLSRDEHERRLAKVVFLLRKNGGVGCLVVSKVGNERGLCWTGYPLTGAGVIVYDTQKMWVVV